MAFQRFAQPESLREWQIAEPIRDHDRLRVDFTDGKFVYLEAIGLFPSGEFYHCGWRLDTALMPDDFRTLNRGAPIVVDNPYAAIGGCLSFEAGYPHRYPYNKYWYGFIGRFVPFVLMPDTPVATAELNSNLVR